MEFNEHYYLIKSKINLFYSCKVIQIKMFIMFKKVIYLIFLQNLIVKLMMKTIIVNFIIVLYKINLIYIKLMIYFIF